MSDFNWPAAIPLDPADSEPIYQQIANAIAAMVRAGQVEPDTKLPPQRKLADALDVNVTTIARAYTELRNRQLVVSGVGSGTYVARGGEPAPEASVATVPAQSSDDPDMIDLSINRAANGRFLEFYAEALRSLPEDPRFAELQEYLPPEGASWAREAGCRWVARSGLVVPPQRMVVTSGAQQGLYAVLAAITEPGDVVAANRITYYGLKSLASLLHLEIVAIDVDEKGLLPGQLDELCAQRPVKALFTVPTLHNPTAVTVPEDRRREIAEVARRHELFILEDDVYSPLLEKPLTPMSRYYPEMSFYVSATSKSLAPGLRIGFVVPPPAYRMHVIEALRTTYWMATPSAQLIATRWIESGTAFELARQSREELQQRNAIARKLLEGQRYTADPCCTHLWLELPDRWRASEFAAHASHLGVRVLPSEVFAVGRGEVPHAVRVNVSAARTHEELARGLKTLTTILRQRPQNIFSAV